MGELACQPVRSHCKFPPSLYNPSLQAVCAACCLPHVGVLLDLFFDPAAGRDLFLLLTFTGLHCVISQKTEIFRYWNGLHLETYFSRTSWKQVKTRSSGKN
jgi:hypothetical protein